MDHFCCNESFLSVRSQRAVYLVCLFPTWQFRRVTRACPPSRPSSLLGCWTNGGGGSGGDGGGDGGGGDGGGGGGVWVDVWVCVRVCMYVC